MKVARASIGWGSRTALVIALLSPSAMAQSLGDSVRQHVDQGLEKQTKKEPPRNAEPPRKAKKKPTKRRPARSTGSPDMHWSSSDAPEPAAPADPDPLPRRVFGDQLKLDPTAGVGFRGWAAQDYPLVRVPHTGFFTWNVDLKGRFFKLITLRRGYYESNGLSAPRNQTASTVEKGASFVPKAAWLLGALGFEISKAWQPIVSYETRAFESSAIPRAPVRIVPLDATEDTPLESIPATQEPLRMVSGFETFVAGVRYDHSKTASGMIGGGATNTIPPFYVGVGLIQYSKPYQVRVANDVNNDLLFDARFRGAGLAVGTSTPEQPDKFFLDFSGQLGLGEVRLTDHLTLNRSLPSDWLIGYGQGNLTVGYLYPLLRTRPTVFLSGALNGGGMTFFFFKTKAQQGEETRSPSLNWDFLWGARLALTIPL